MNIDQDTADATRKELAHQLQVIEDTKDTERMLLAEIEALRSRRDAADQRVYELLEPLEAVNATSADWRYVVGGLEPKAAQALTRHAMQPKHGYRRVAEDVRDIGKSMRLANKTSE